ncbi:MAG: DUF4124 domain-containing protein [Myxococcales bacterium]|nr:DUF4124 domain-containing protein [Myxococcales bacterium]TDI98318.1 MAG: DUF4124 domain-containing protein [Deltaproteobacteria bacterium]
MMRPISLFAALVLGLMLWSPSHPAAAETYSYVDEQGKMHFTDAYHSIPKRYRNRVQAQGGAEPGDVAGILGLPGQTAKVGNRMTGMLIQGINKARKSKDLRPLVSAQRREVAQFTDERLVVLLISSAVLALFAILLGIHGFLTGRPIWAIANLALLIPTPVYVALHLANNKGFVKLLAFAAVLAPTVVMLKTSLELHSLMQKLLV